MTSSDTRARVDNIIFNETLRRFTQDSPVLGDVWQEYMALAVGHHGDERVDLLLEPPKDVSTWKSVVSTKADAATRLFDLSCSKLAWAVIDSGIDATHPAFRRRQGKKAVALDREAIGCCTRVKKTCDFNLLRELTQVEIDDDVDGLAHLTSETRATVQELRQGLRSGRIIDWGGLESALQLTTGGRPPMSEHGTHVAGILAGDWRDGDDEDEAPPKARLHGMCPDLTLYDLRVLDDEGSGSEFSVLAALQFVRYLNSGKNQPVIDGVNVSMSIRHDVANYACGRTPVCDECERVVASGVVVVAAAGNAGYRTGEGVASPTRPSASQIPGTRRKSLRLAPPIAASPTPMGCRTSQAVGRPVMAGASLTSWPLGRKSWRQCHTGARRRWMAPAWQRPTSAAPRRC